MIRSEELAALRSGAGLVAAPPFDLLELAGPDRLQLLHGLVTCDVRQLAPGEMVAGFFTERQGKILADFVAFQGEVALRLLLPPGRGEAIAAHLDKYRLAARVEIRPLPATAALEVSGPRAGEALAAWSGASAPEAARAKQLAGEGGAVEVVPLPAASGGSRLLLFAEASELEPVSKALLRKAESVGLRRVSVAAREVARIEDGALRFGVDFDSDHFPQETGREGDVSYTKGCYLGQEVIARIHYRGGVQRQPYGLRFPGGLPASGAVLLHDGRPAGRATSVADSPRFGPIGLGILHRRVGEPPARLELEAGGPAELTALPVA